MFSEKFLLKSQGLNTCVKSILTGVATVSSYLGVLILVFRTVK